MNVHDDVAFVQALIAHQARADDRPVTGDERARRSRPSPPTLVRRVGATQPPRMEKSDECP